MYKTISDSKIYESTICHTREFWKRRGFTWSDIENEGRYFHYNNGSDRKMDNYFDTIQLLSIHSMNRFKPVQVTLENKDIVIPELVDKLKGHTEHPLTNFLQEIYKGNISILGIQSEFLNNISDDKWETTLIQQKCKEKEILRTIKDKEFNVLIFGSKQPIWSIFEQKSFQIIILETSKNYEQMNSIILGCKKYEYVPIKGYYILKSWITKS